MIRDRLYFMKSATVEDMALACFLPLDTSEQFVAATLDRLVEDNIATRDGDYYHISKDFILGGERAAR